MEQRGWLFVVSSCFAMLVVAFLAHGLQINSAVFFFLHVDCAECMARQDNKDLRKSISSGRGGEEAFVECNMGH
jgi:hypothetical protein